jgi:hypothetical protein
MIFPIKIEDAEIPEGLNKFQWTNYSVNGLDRMVSSLLSQQQKWEAEITPPKISMPPIFNLRESWPWLSVLMVALVLLIVNFKLND